MKSRQVQRAEFRAEMKRGKRIGKLRKRERKQVERERRNTPASTLRIAAKTAVSKLSRSVFA